MLYGFVFCLALTSCLFIFTCSVWIRNYVFEAQLCSGVFQVDLLLSFCSEMGFSSVVLVGHDDGGLLALKATQRVQESMTSFNVSSSTVK